jgi:hypothetical protein
MQEIARVLEREAIGYCCAATHGRGVRSREAYHATGTTQVLPRSQGLVFVACSVTGLASDIIIDHHNEGNPGYGMPPARFREGSSLGQSLALLGLEPSDQRLIMPLLNPEWVV